MSAKDFNLPYQAQQKAIHPPDLRPAEGNTKRAQLPKRQKQEFSNESIQTASLRSAEMTFR